MGRRQERRNWALLRRYLESDQPIVRQGRGACRRVRAFLDGHLR
jgi:hypothetical protein